MMSSSSITTSPIAAAVSETPGAISQASGNDLLSKPGHVYWHNTPSPSQQIRQREFQRYLLSNNASSPILPLGTQAFREELLLQREEGKVGGSRSSQREGFGRKEGEGRGTPVQKCCQGVGHREHEHDDCGRASTSSTSKNRSIDHRRNSMGGESASYHSSSTPASNSSFSSRKFSRRISRRSMVVTTGGDTSATSSSSSFLASKAINQQAEGVHQLLVDLNRHLKTQRVDVEEEGEIMRTSEDRYGGAPGAGIIDDDDHLIKELDRMFSSPDIVSQNETERSKGQIELKRKGESVFTPADKRIATLQQSSPSPSSSREWCRTKSSPAELEASPESSSTTNSVKQRSTSMMRGKSRSTRDPFVSVVTKDKRQRLFFDEGESQGEEAEVVAEDSRPGSGLPLHGRNGDESVPVKVSEESNAASLLPTLRTSPRKRSALSEIGVAVHDRDLFGVTRQMDGELRRRLDARREEGTVKNKSRSSVSPPKKWANRAPRIGLSRQASVAALSQQNGQSQSTNSHSSLAKPAAPFKQPTNRGMVNAAAKSDAKYRWSSTSIPSEERKQQQQQQQQQQPVIVIDDSEKEEKQRAIPVAIAANEDEGDTTFDTSMDDIMLCDAVDLVEATQRSGECQNQIQTTTVAGATGATAGSKSQSIPNGNGKTVGDDSFDMDSSDNEAIVCAMEAGGW